MNNIIGLLFTLWDEISFLFCLHVGLDYITLELYKSESNEGTNNPYFNLIAYVCGFNS